MSEGKFSSLVNFISNGGKICILSREIGVRKSIISVIDEIGLSRVTSVVPDDFNYESVRKDFFSSLGASKDLLVIMDITSENSASYFRVLDELYSKYQERLKVVAIVDMAYQGLISLLFARGAKVVMVKPFSPKDLKLKVMSIFSRLSPNDKLVESGRGYLEQNDSNAAFMCCEKIMETGSHSHNTLLFCGDVYLSLGEFQVAAKFFLMALKAEKMSFQAYACLAKLLRAKNKLKGELYWLRKFAKINTLDFNNFVKMGELNLKLGNDDDSKSCFDKALQVARKISHPTFISELTFNIASICAENNCIGLGKEYSSSLLKDGNVDKHILTKIAFFRMLKLNDLEGAANAFHLLAVREERRYNNIDLESWSSALYNAAICHHIADRNKRIIKKKNGPKRASDVVLEILSMCPDFGKDNKQINSNIIAIASNPLQPNPALVVALRNDSRI